MYPDPSSVTRVTTLGTGPIGGGWAAHFLARGYDVTAYIHCEDERPALMTIIDVGWISLEALGLAKISREASARPLYFRGEPVGLAQDASRDRLKITTDLDVAVRDAQFIQESAPERLELKQALYKRLGELARKDCIIASSTSGLMMTDIQKDCSTPERTVVGHPFNPPYLLPLVEIVGGKKTDPAAVEWAAEFYRTAGKAPLVMKKEIPGFVATRLQEALWREALHMVANGEATPEDIDNALMNGPAPRMAVQGQCMAFHVACGEGGMATNLDQFGPALKWPWSRLEAPELTQELRDRMIDGCNAIVGERHFEDMAEQRDREIIAVLNAIRETRGV